MSWLCPCLQANRKYPPGSSENPKKGHVSGFGKQSSLTNAVLHDQSPFGPSCLAFEGFVSLSCVQVFAGLFTFSSHSGSPVTRQNLPHLLGFLWPLLDCVLGFDPPVSCLYRPEEMIELCLSGPLNSCSHEPTFTNGTLGPARPGPVPSLCRPSTHFSTHT